VFIWKGQGRILVNRKPLDAFFRDVLMRSHVLKPLMTTGLVDKMDVLVHVQGGGVSGQAQAAAHGIAKALVRLDPSLKPTLKAQLRRDPRAVERKKPGKAKARKAFAWVKR
jgi:ribosomal protein S9